jgi:branched-chain amino acid transport system substrate-binding protein
VKLTHMASVAALLVAVGGTVGCGGSSTSSADSKSSEGSASGTITIGSTLPLTGPLAPLGNLVKTGTEQAVADANADGGIRVGDGKRKVKLVILDNKTDPNQVTEQARTLITQDKAVALVGSVTPPLAIPLSNVVERSRVPAVISNTPVLAWQAGNPNGWHYAWDVYTNEQQFTALDFQSAALVNTNKKVALFTDTEDDGVVIGKLWTQEAPKYGFKIAYRAQFPVGTTDFGQYIKKAKAAGADVMLAIMIPPDAIALWKQMKALGWAPKIASCQKCSHTAAWPQALGPLAAGAMQMGWWDPGMGHPGTDRIQELFKNVKLIDRQHIAANYAITKVLLDAISRAGSSDPAKINEALRTTNLDTVLGPIKFDDKNTSTLKAFMNQWQGSDVKRIYPPGDGAAAPVSPMPGF